jgi:hypothetical protein
VERTSDEEKGAESRVEKWRQKTKEKRKTDYRLKSNKNSWKRVSGKQRVMQGIRGRQKQEVVRRKLKEKEGREERYKEEEKG